MKPFELPDDIFSDRSLLASEIIFYHYSSQKDSIREKSVLKRNAFSLVITGTKIMHFAEKTVQVESNTIHLLSSGNCIASVSVNHGKPFESLLIFFSDELFRECWHKYIALIPSKSTGNKEPQSYLEFRKDEPLQYFIESILAELKSKRNLSEAVKKNRLEWLILYLIENHPDDLLSFTQAPLITDIQSRIRKAVEANAKSNLTVEELAFLCNVSVSTFKRHFRKLYNCSPIEWTNKQRMLLAGKMLATENPSELWSKLGFETHTGFTKSFKRYFGMPPKEYKSKLTFRE